MWLSIVFTILIYFAIASIISSLYHSYFRYKIIGGYWGAVCVGFLGATIGGFSLNWLFLRIADLLGYLLIAVNWLMKNADHEILPPVNIIAAIAGAYLFIYFLKRVTSE